MSTLVLQMNSTFKFVGIGPPTRPFLLVGPRRTRARDAADRAIARVVQRVERDLVRLDVAPDLLLAPVRERLDLPDAVTIGALDLAGVGARRRLVAADAGDPGVVGLERLDERLDLRMWQQRSGFRSQRFGPSCLCCSATVMISGRISLSP